MTEPARTPADLAAALDREVAGLERELSEIELLAGQARSESGRHEQKRSHLADKLAALIATPGADRAEIAEENVQLVTLTKRFALMDAQIEVLQGKQKVLMRYRDGLANLRGEVAVLAGLEPLRGAPAPAASGVPAASDPSRAAASGVASASMYRVLQSALEDLRRDIARAMHDGPAQSLTNIVLQAQIVERLIDRDPAAARAEVRDLVGMVQRTLDTTKTFIFDVRPMVLDDLGLMPTLRRVARDRSRRAQVPVELDSLGPDRRLPMELESAVFRIVDESVAALAATHPERVTVTLFWGATELTTTVRAQIAARDEEPVLPAPGADVPAALVSMIESRRADRAAVVAAGGVPADVRREITDRATALGGRVGVAADGQTIEVVVPIPPTADEAPAADAG
jgi:two-component system, NarL family, sensor histidine kinase DegS